MCVCMHSYPIILYFLQTPLDFFFYSFLLFQIFFFLFDFSPLPICKLCLFLLFTLEILNAYFNRLSLDLINIFTFFLKQNKDLKANSNLPTPRKKKRKRYVR